MIVFNQKEADMVIKVLDAMQRQADEQEGYPSAAEKQAMETVKWFNGAGRRARMQGPPWERTTAVLKKRSVYRAGKASTVKIEPPEADTSHFLSLGTLGSSTPPAANSYFGTLTTRPSRIQNARISNGNAAQAKDGFPASWAKMPSPFTTPPSKTETTSADTQRKMPTLSTPSTTASTPDKKDAKSATETMQTSSGRLVSFSLRGDVSAQLAASKDDDPIKDTSSESSSPTILTPEDKSHTGIDDALASAKRLVSDLESTKACLDQVATEFDEKDMTIKKMAAQHEKLSQRLAERESEIRDLNERFDYEMKESFTDHEKIKHLEKQLSNANNALKLLAAAMDVSIKKSGEEKLKKLTELAKALDADFGGIENAKKLLRGPSFESLELMLELLELETGKKLLS